MKRGAGGFFSRVKGFHKKSGAGGVFWWKETEPSAQRALENQA